MYQHVLYFTYLDKLTSRIFCLNSLNQNKEKMEQILLDIGLFETVLKTEDVCEILKYVKNKNEESITFNVI